MRVEPKSTELARRAPSTPPAPAPAPAPPPAPASGPAAESAARGTLGIRIAGSTDAEPNKPPMDVSALNAVHLPVEPGLLALRLKSAPAGGGIFDGAWWPHSRDVHAELPGLVNVLSQHLGPIDRIGLDADAWDGLGEPLFADGRLIQVDWFPLGDDTVILTSYGHGDFSLLAIPPDAGVDEAHAALTMVTHIGDPEDGQQILVATGISQPRVAG